MVYQACENTKTNFSSLIYALLGDDIVICDSRVSEEYIRLMTSYGVSISKLKTHVSVNFYEFAKRMYYKGHEVTPFPISALKSSQKRYYLLVSLMVQEKRKGWVPNDGIPSAIESFYTMVKPLRSKFRKKLSLWSEATELMIYFIRKDKTASEVINTLGRRITHS